MIEEFGKKKAPLKYKVATSFDFIEYFFLFALFCCFGSAAVMKNV